MADSATPTAVPTEAPTETSPRSLAQQLSEVYALIDELHDVSDRLDRSVQSALTTIKTEGETP